MGFSVEEHSGSVISNFLYKFALILEGLRWSMNWVFRFMIFWESYDAERRTQNQTCATSSSVSAQEVREMLAIVTYSEISSKKNGSTCAICLNQLRSLDKVRELRNCCHVFHKRCLDRWVEHDEHKTCPLCRVPLLSCLSSSSSSARSEPNWAVEHLLYLFGDDLLLQYGNTCYYTHDT